MRPKDPLSPIRVVALAAALACGSACSEDASGVPDAPQQTTCSVTGVSVTTGATHVGPGENATLTASVTSSGPCTGGVAWTATPSGATLTPNGTQATFSATTAGVYTIKATSTDDGTKSGGAMVTVATACGVANGVTVEHKTAITSNETWAGFGVTHLVSQTIAIKAPATVTIEPCAIVVVAAGAEIDVTGDVTGNQTAKLVAAGTDDVTGFITVSPQMAGKPWGQIRGVNPLSLVELHHTTLKQGGGDETFHGNAPIEMNGPGDALPPVAVLTADHLTIDRPVGSGVYLKGSSAFTDASTQLTVIGAADHPIRLAMMALASIPPFVSMENPIDDALVMGSTAYVFADLTITNRIPVRIKDQTVVVAPPDGSSLPMVTLTVQPGATIRLEGGVSFSVGSVGGANRRIGRLLAVGDAAHPIRFTSGAATPAPGDWAGLYLYNADGSKLDYVTVEYAGGFSGLISTNCRPSGAGDVANIIIGSDAFIPPADMITHSVIQFSAGFGIDAVWSGPTFNAPNLTDPANGNTFASNARCDQSFNGLAAGSGLKCPSGGGCQPQ